MKSIAKKAATKFEVFVSVISQKQNANRWEKNQGNVSQVNKSPHAKIQFILLSTFNNDS